MEPAKQAAQKPHVSPFLDPGIRTKANSLAILQLSHDNFLPVYLDQSKGEVDGYAEGAVINTRFGSFPHSTLLDVPWGSQVRASTVDTGSRGRKRKRTAAMTDDTDEQQPNEDGGDAGPRGEERERSSKDSKRVKEAVAANSGFVHILHPTPELWTSSLPHRTQVVYTPDYSYILHRIRARPGSTVIEAGSGSGSFSHASARAVYSGYPEKSNSQGESHHYNRRGTVYSYEFNEVRYRKMKQEIADHNLEGIIHLTHRDVYSGGFLVEDGRGREKWRSPRADAIFLDLPAPWKAIPHLSRTRPESLAGPSGGGREKGEDDENDGWVSPLNPKRTVYLCTFSPCIEQVTRTIDALRKHGWVEIDMVELAHKRINVLRERVGMMVAQEKGASHTPRDVMEAVERLRKVEARAREFQKKGRKSTLAAGSNAAANDDDDDGDEDDLSIMAQEDDADETQDEADNTPSWLQGRLVHRTESEIKTHTSYLTFAVLPRAWSSAQDNAALKAWPVGLEIGKMIGSLNREARKQEKRELLLRKTKRNKMAKTNGPASGSR